MCRVSAVVERLEVFLSTRIQITQPDLEEAGVALVVSRVSIISKRQLGIENLSQSDSIRGVMETEGCMTVARDKSLPRAVAKAKLAKAIAATGKDFMEKWNKSMKK